MENKIKADQVEIKNPLKENLKRLENENSDLKQKLDNKRRKINILT